MIYFVELLQEEGWVVCRAFKKKLTGQTKTNNMIEGWESNYFYDEATTTVSSIVDPLEYITRQPPPTPSNFNMLQNNLLCKQEISMEAAENNLNFSYTNSDQFIQLPQLESPSLPLLKRPISSMSLISNNNNNNNNHEDDGSKNVTADWRALDKFVASQLSHEETTLYEDDHHNCSDLGMLLLLSDRGEGPKLNEILSSSSEDCDIGVCLFDK